MGTSGFHQQQPMLSSACMLHAVHPCRLSRLLLPLIHSPPNPCPMHRWLW
jgi:hypothetical protein